MTRERLSALDASFLDVESDAGHMHVGWVARFTPPARRVRPTFAQLRRHIAARLDRAPRYRQRLVRDVFELYDPVWEDDPGFRIERHVRHCAGRRLDPLVEQVLSRPLDRERPLWEVWIADELADGSIGMVGKAHHCMVDGVAAVELGSLLLDVEPDAKPVPQGDWRPSSGPHPIGRLAAATLRRGGDLAGSLGALGRRAAVPVATTREVTRALRAAGNAARPVEPHPLFNPPSSPRRVVAGRSVPIEELRRVKRAFGATVNDVVLAAAASGLRGYARRRGKEVDDLKAMVPVSVRPDGAERELGNRISFVFVDLPCRESEARRRLRAVSAAMGALKRSGAPQGANALLGALQLTPRTLRRRVARMLASPRTFNVVVSNIPGPPQPLYMLGCELVEVFPVVPLAEDHAVSIGVTSVNGRACFGVYADGERFDDPDELADGVAAGVGELLDAAARAERGTVAA